MIKLIKLNLIFVVALLFTSCATSITPFKVNTTLSTLTESKFITYPQVEEAMKGNKCKYLVKGRNYTAPMGLTKKDDLKKGARGIDEWVKLDGGNSYLLISYKWVTVDEEGSTQLQLEFDTLLCE